MKKKKWHFRKYKNLDWDIKREREKDKKVIESFNFAIEGTIEAIRREKHMRVHIFASIVIMILAIISDLNKMEIIALFLTITLVVSAELVNTAIEAVVDLISPKWHPLAKLAKDVAAGAVLVTSINAMIVGYLLFYDKAINLMNLEKQTVKIAGKLGYLVVLILALVSVVVITLKAFFKKGTPLEGGMPSGHSAIAFSIFALILSLTQDMKIVVLAFMMALLVAQSRVKAKIHSFKEVFFGAMIGFLITYTIMFLVKYFGNLHL